VGTLPTQRTRAEWRQIILEDLGGDGVDPDLSPRNLDAALSRTLDLWNMYRPMKAWYPFEIPSPTGDGGYRITFFADEARTDNRVYPTGFVRSVLDVRFVDRNQRTYGLTTAPSSDFFIARWGYQGPRLFFELQNGQKTYERLLGSRPAWHWNPETRELWITVPSQEMAAMVLCSRDRRLVDIPYDHQHYFRKAAVAAAKTILARVQGSRGPIPGPAGEITTDAAELRAEGKEEWREVEEKLQTALTSYPPIGWIG